MGNKVYEIVTNQIIEKLKNGELPPWKKSWSGGGFPTNFISKKHYRGINSFLLNMQGYSCPYWATFKQISGKGGKVKKGEKGSIVIFWKVLKKENEDNEKEESFPFMRFYKVWNLEQTEGIEYDKGIVDNDNDPIEVCQFIIDSMKNVPTIKHETQRAFYTPSTDEINIPKFNSFDSSEEYYSTLFHELTHSTGHISRLNRDTVTQHNGFGSREYSKEELIAEMGAAFLCGYTKIENSTIENSASYIKGWLSKLKEDPKLIIKAGSAAQKAADYILGEE